LVDLDHVISTWIYLKYKFGFRDIENKKNLDTSMKTYIVEGLGIPNKKPILWKAL
jgi:hypothetical protein